MSLETLAWRLAQGSLIICHRRGPHIRWGRGDGRPATEQSLGLYVAAARSPGIKQTLHRHRVEVAVA